jgi:hypothetical protein
MSATSYEFTNVIARDVFAYLMQNNGEISNGAFQDILSIHGILPTEEEPLPDSYERSSFMTVVRKAREDVIKDFKEKKLNLDCISRRPVIWKLIGLDSKMRKSLEQNGIYAEGRHMKLIKQLIKFYNEEGLLSVEMEKRLEEFSINAFRSTVNHITTTLELLRLINPPKKEIGFIEDKTED